MLEKKYKKLGGKIVIDTLRIDQKHYIKALENSNRFSSPEAIESLASKISKIISIENQAGEGWLLTGEMIELIEIGVKNILCMQPFGCLPNNITGKGVIKYFLENF